MGEIRVAWHRRAGTFIGILGLIAACAAPAFGQITSPAPGSTLTGSTVTFQWTAATGVKAYILYVGSSQGSGDIYLQNRGQSTSATVTGIPTDGRTIYVRLSLVANSVQSTDYTYT